ncbi:MAG: hypothetical protein ACXWEY_00730 [Bacteroidia bacterium]
MKHTIYILFLILIPAFTFGQDTLFFKKKGNSEKRYFIELNKYLVKIKPINGKKFWAYIVNYNDTALILKARTYNKETRNQIRTLSSHLIDSIQKNNLSLAQQDSAFLRLTEQQEDIEYPNIEELDISSIKKITVNNYLRPDKKKMMQIVDATGYSALAGMLLVGPTLTLINPIFIPVTGFFYVYGIACIPVAIIAETKQLNLQRTWDIVK